MIKSNRRGPETTPIIILASALTALTAVFAAGIWWLLPTIRPWTLTLAGVFVLLITSTCWWWQHLVSAKLAAVTAQLHAARSGHASYSMTLNDEGWFSALNNDIYQYVRQTSNLQTSLENDRRQLTHAITDIAHQLRTPIAASQNVLELLTATNLPASKVTLRAQNERLTDLAAKLILLARVDTHTLGQSKQAIHLDPLVRQALNPLLPLIADAQLTIDWQVPAPFTLAVNPTLAQEALVNVLKNAIEHAQPGTILAIHASQTPMSTTLTIRNHGALIDAVDLDHIFDRFYRGRASAPNSLGVGLAIAQGIMTAGDGRISLANTTDGVQTTLEWFR